MAAAITLSTMTLLPGTVQAQNRTMSESSQQQLDQRLADVSVRLNLTDSQRGQVKPILRASMQKQTFQNIQAERREQLMKRFRG